MPEITLEDDIKIRTFEPSPGLDPLTASPAELEKNGFPARPDDPHHLARYKRVFGLLKPKFQYVVPTFRVNPEKRHGPRKRLPEAGTETSTNWSGGVVYAPQGQSFIKIQGDWVIPDVDAPTTNKWYYCASWIGIDGDGSSSDVCQAGVECEVYRTGNSISRNIYPWIEWFPGPEVQITNLAINPGDMVTMLISSSANATTAHLAFSNRTTGVSTSLNFNAPARTKLVGNCAEWIVEAPQVGGVQSAIADYGEVFFSVCEAIDQRATVNGGTGNNINMTVGNKVVSQGVLIAPTVIQCLYEGGAPALA